MRAFPVKLPSGKRYWTVIDERLQPVGAVDRFLRDARFGRDMAESTTKTYAGALALFLRWCAATNRDWGRAAEDLASFIVWLRHTPTKSERTPVHPGPGALAARGERRINLILTAVRGFLVSAVAAGDAEQHVLEQLYQVEDARDLPQAARGEYSGPGYRLAAHHRLHEPQRPVERLSDEQVIALLLAARSSRDRVIVLLMARAGLRRGEVAGLRRSDLHLLVDNMGLGCRIAAAHVHVVPRDNSNGAWAKSRLPRSVPLDHMVVQALDLYAVEREACRPAAESDFLLVNLFRAPVGAPMRPNAINELITALARRAGIGTRVTPHMARHAFASNVVDAGGSLDEVQRLLGHATPESSQIYLHPDPERLRRAVERIGTLSRVKHTAMPR